MVLTECRTGRCTVAPFTVHSGKVTELARRKKVPAAFYRTEMGTEPVRDWLKSLAVEDRKIIGEDLQTLEYGWPVGMPIWRSLREGLWELRSTIRHGIARIIFFVHQEELVLLNAS